MSDLFEDLEGKIENYILRYGAVYTNISKDNLHQIDIPGDLIDEFFLTTHTSFTSPLITGNLSLFNKEAEYLQEIPGELTSLFIEKISYSYWLTKSKPIPDDDDLFDIPKIISILIDRDSNSNETKALLSKVFNLDSCPDPR